MGTTMENIRDMVDVNTVVGDPVETADGVGVVIEMRPLAEQVKVRLSETNKEDIRLYSCKDIKVLKVGNGKRVKDGNDND